MRIETFALNGTPSSITFFGNEINSGVLLGKLVPGEFRPFFPYPDILEPVYPRGIRLEKGLHQDLETVPFFPLGLGMLTDLFKDGMEGRHHPKKSFRLKFKERQANVKENKMETHFLACAELCTWLQEEIFQRFHD